MNVITNAFIMIYNIEQYTYKLCCFYRIEKVLGKFMYLAKTEV